MKTRHPRPSNSFNMFSSQSQITTKYYNLSVKFQLSTYNVALIVSYQIRKQSDEFCYWRHDTNILKKKSYSLVLMAFDGRFKGLSQLNIDVLDVNDNRPHCIETMINLKISENATVGTSIYEVKAYDPDQLSLSYEILTNEENFLIDQIHLNRTGHNNRAIREKLAAKHINTLPFHVNGKSGSIRLSEPLDYEIQRSYSFFVRIIKTSEQTNENQNNRNHRSFKTFIQFEYN